MVSKSMKGENIKKGANNKKMFSREISCEYALGQIIKKFGRIEKEERYYHRGNGDFSKENLVRDGKHKGKFKVNKNGKVVDPDRNEWHMYDRPKRTRIRIYNKDGSKKKTISGKDKRVDRWI